MDRVIVQCISKKLKLLRSFTDSRHMRCTN